MMKRCIKSTSSGWQCTLEAEACSKYCTMHKRHGPAPTKPLVSGVNVLGISVVVIVFGLGLIAYLLKVAFSH
jgi:hypothetical protein